MLSFCKRRKTIRWYLVEGGAFNTFKLNSNFGIIRPTSLTCGAYRHKHMKLFINTVMKQIYVFNNVAWNYRNRIGFPVCRKGAPEAQKERSCQSYFAPHIKKERSVRFTAQPLSALILTDGPTLSIETLAVKNLELFKWIFGMICNLTAYYLHILNRVSNNYELSQSSVVWPDHSKCESETTSPNE